MFHFESDYQEGAHPRILELLAKTNFEQTEGYGEDHYCKNAASLIARAIGRENVDIHFLVGGTQANLTAISAFLRPHEGAVCASSGHINTHETGAVEATGHKILSLPSKDGKVSEKLLAELLEAHYQDVNREHTVKPGLLYLSDSTEIGTIYRKEELKNLSQLCKKYGLILFLDGARLGSALTCMENNLTLSDLAQLCDAFTIGGTKNGALFGEALVISAPSLKKDFRYFIKQRGGMLAKGRLLGLQFQALFEDQLYFDLASHANQMASLLQNALENEGIKFLIKSPSNQIFPIFSNTQLSVLSEKYGFTFWEKTSAQETAVRMVTSWATPEEKIYEFISDIQALK